MNTIFLGSKMHLGQWLEFSRAYDKEFNALSAIRKFYTIWPRT